MWIWSWGDWGDVTDRFTGHPDSVDKIVKYDEDTILTGSADGLIRVVTIHPNKLLGVVGQHEDYPVDKLAMSYDRKFLASCPSDSTIKFWGINFLSELDEEDEENEEEDEQDSDGEEINGEEGSDQGNVEEDEENDVEDEGEEQEDVEEDSEENNTNVKKPVKMNNNDEESNSDVPKKVTGVKRKKEDEDESVSEKPSSKKSKKEKLNNTPLGKFFADL